MSRTLALAIVLLVLITSFFSAQSSWVTEELRSTTGLPPDVVGLFREPAAFQQTPTGDTYVFDRRANSVYRIDASGNAQRIVQIGPEDGRLLGASSFHLGTDGRFVVADAPEGLERVQIFAGDGTRLGGFRLPGRASPRVTLGDLVLTGVASLQYTGQVILMNQPELGGLITKFSLRGHPFNTFGVFRFTGHEEDRDLHLALNSGFPLENPLGGYYFVFQAGVPTFRKYDDQGVLRFERHIEGIELDPVIAALPNTWARKSDNRGRTLPIVFPTVRTAAVDPEGYLWIALTVPYIYVYNPDGEKVRTIRLRGAGILNPTSLFFPRRNRLLVTPGCYEFKVR